MAVDQGDDHFAGGAYNGFVQMPAENLPLIVSGAHVNVCIKLAVHGVDGACQGYDLKAALKRIGVILFFIDLIHAHREIVGGA